MFSPCVATIAEMTLDADCAAVPRAKLPRWWLLGLMALPFLLVGGFYGLVWHWRASSTELLGAARMRFEHADGSPVAGVAARVYWTTLRGFGPYYTCEDIGPSAADGTVDLGSLVGEWAIGAKFEIEVDLLGFVHEHMSLARETTIVLPPVGRAVLRLVDGRGEPYTKPLPRQGACLIHQHDARSQQRNVYYGPDGSVDFGLVACGSRLKLLARVQGAHAIPVGFDEQDEHRPRRVLTHEIVGPDGPGDVREIVCMIPAESPRLHAVVQDANGTPVQRDFRLAVRYGGSSLSAFTVTTDAQGRLEFLLGQTPTHDGELKLWAGGTSPITVVAAVTQDGDLDAGIVRLP